MTIRCNFSFQPFVTMHRLYLWSSWQLRTFFGSGNGEFCAKTDGIHENHTDHLLFFEVRDFSNQTSTNGCLDPKFQEDVPRVHKVEPPLLHPLPMPWGFCWGGIETSSPKKSRPDGFILLNLDKLPDYLDLFVGWIFTDCTIVNQRFSTTIWENIFVIYSKHLKQKNN